MRAYTLPCESKQIAETKAAELRQQHPDRDRFEIMITREPDAEAAEVYVAEYEPGERTAECLPDRMATEG